MDIETVLKWTDDLVFAKTQKRLDTLQKAILKGTWQRQTHAEIAEDYHCTNDHVRKTASELWKLLSEILGEEIRKSNVRSILENAAFSNTYFNWGDDSVQIGDINICRENCPYQKVAKSRSPTTRTNPEKHHDLTDAPTITSPFYNRTQELTTLKQWMLAENSRLIFLLGLPGMGKTAIAQQLLQRTQNKFDRLLWRSHRQFPTLESLQTNLIEFLSPKSPPTSASIIDCLRSHPCLIILDDLQQTFTTGELAGTFCPDYQNYGEFLEQIAESSHKSCLLLIGREKPIEIAPLEIENRHCRTLKLGSLGESARKILKARKLTDEDRWSELIDLYGGNPSWLNIIAATIQQLFNGSVAELLSSSTLFLGDLEPILQALYRRLSESEKLAIASLATQPAPIQVARKPANFPFSQSDFWKAVQSLGRCCLLETVTDESSSQFALVPAIAQFVFEVRGLSSEVRGFEV